MDQTKEVILNTEDDILDRDFDFSKSKPNPYYKKLTDEVTFRIGKDVIAYFNKLAEEKKMPIENVINMYLYECMVNKHDPHFPWENQVSE